MKTSEAYDRYLIKTEKNSTNDNISTDKQRFVEQYNEYQIRFLEYFYDRKNTDDFRYIESLLIPAKRLDKSDRKSEYYSFNLPNNYFNLSSVYALGSKGKCKNKKIDLFIDLFIDLSILSFRISIHLRLNSFSSGELVSFSFFSCAISKHISFIFILFVLLVARRLPG